MFHLWKGFREYHFVLRGAIQNEAFFLAGETTMRSNIFYQRNIKLMFARAREQHVQA